MQRITVTMNDEHLEALRTVTEAHGSTVSGTIRAAATSLRVGDSGADAIRRLIEPDRRGGARSGAGRRKAGAR